jgi:4-hydroxybenzoate polyprenyltransferase
MLIANGFLVRAVGGALVIGVEPSPWFVTCIGFGSLFLALNKRQAELRLLQGDAAAHREVLEEYSTELLRQLTTITTACTLLSYAVFTFLGEHNKSLMLTLPFVLYGMFRYLWLVEVRDEGGEPEVVFLQDRPLQVTLVLFALAVLATLRWPV